MPQYVQIAKPLTQLLRKEFQFRCSELQQSAFVNLKAALCTEQVLAYPNFKDNFILTTDASEVAVAAILSQVQDGVERPISYVSRQMNNAEQNYSASETEMCVRWSLRLTKFNFTVEHRPGTQIRNVDNLSRAIKTVQSCQELPRDEVKKAQARDKFCQKLDVGGVKSSSEYFADEDGIIHRRLKTAEHQLVVPASLVERVINLNHDPATVGHPGRNRTLGILCLRFY